MRSKIWIFFVLSLFLLTLLQNCSNNNNRKIKLSDENDDSIDVQTVSSTIRVAPEEQNTIAIFYFENGSEDASLNWLRRGLTDMLVAELSQSPYFNVVPVQQLLENAKKLGYETSDLYNSSIALKIAELSKAESVLCGRFYTDGDSLNIDLLLMDVASGKILRQETVRGSGLEQIFLMVNDLSDRMRTNLRGKLAKARQGQEFSLVDMTQSVEAYRYFSAGLENIDKFLWTDADSCFQKAISYDSTFAEAYLNLSKVKKQMGDGKAAFAALEKARQYSDKLSKIGQIQLKMYYSENHQDMESLLAVMNELLQYAPYNLQIREQLGATLMGMRRYDQALEEYEYIVELDPLRKLAYNQIGYLYAFRGDYTNALKYLEKYQKLAPSEPNPHDSMGEVLMMAGRFEEAIEQLKLALQKRPDFYFSALRLSDIYGELGDLNKALEYSDYLMEKAPSEAVKFDAYLDRAALFWRFNKYGEAEQNYKMALEMMPHAAIPFQTLGEFYKSTDREEEAQNLYKRFFDEHKDYFSREKWSVASNLSFIDFCIKTRIPPKEVIPLVKKLYDKTEGGFLKSNYSHVLGLLHLRAGEYPKAEKYLKELDSRFVDVLMETPRLGWRSGGWQYVVESIKLQPKKDSPDFSFYDDMIKKAHRANRNDIEIFMRFVRAFAQEKYGNRKQMLEEYAKLGTPLEDNWRIIGPFKDHCGFVKSFYPEENSNFSTLTSDSKENNLQPGADGIHDGFLDFGALLGHSSWLTAYGMIYIKSPQREVVQIRISSDQSYKVWLNDEQVLQAYRHQKEFPLDNDIVSVVLHHGFNKLLVKFSNKIGDWGFNLRVTDENGNGIPDLEFCPPEKAEESLASNH